MSRLQDTLEAWASVPSIMPGPAPCREFPQSDPRIVALIHTLSLYLSSVNCSSLHIVLFHFIHVNRHASFMRGQ